MRYEENWIPLNERTPYYQDVYFFGKREANKREKERIRKQNQSCSNCSKRVESCESWIKKNPNLPCKSWELKV